MSEVDLMHYLSKHAHIILCTWSRSGVDAGELAGQTHFLNNMQRSDCPR